MNATDLVGWVLACSWGGLATVTVLQMATFGSRTSAPAVALLASSRRAKSTSKHGLSPSALSTFSVPGGPGPAVLLGGTAAVMAGTALIAPALAPLALVMLTWPTMARRRQARAKLARLTEALPETIDLLALAVGAGLTTNQAVRATARRGRGPVADGLAHAVANTAQGLLLADTLEALPARLGEPVRPLTDALIASVRHGAPLAAGLARLGDTARQQRRQAAEARAKRIPVLSLFPLTTCILPAFCLLAVVPLVAVSLQDLRI